MKRKRSRNIKRHLVNNHGSSISKVLLEAAKEKNSLSIFPVLLNELKSSNDLRTQFNVNEPRK